MNSRFLKALHCDNRDDRPPIWLMRQAGRYLPEYQVLRKKHSLKTLFFEPELISEITMQPINRFGLDAAIIFSDICLTAQFLGLDLEYVEGKGPVIHPRLKTKEDVARLKFDANFDFIKEAIRDLKRKLKVPLIGFCGGPFTVASYMIDEKPSQSCEKTLRWIEEDPGTFYQLLLKITDANTEFLKAQKEAGVDAIQVFESSAPSLEKIPFCDFALPYLKLHKDRIKLPMIFYARGTSLHLTTLSLLNPVGIALDQETDLGWARNYVGPDVVLQGNLNVDLLSGPEDILEKKIEEMFWKMGTDPGWIVNVGQGLKPSTRVESVELLIEKVRGYQVEARSY